MVGDVGDKSADG